MTSCTTSNNNRQYSNCSHFLFRYILKAVLHLFLIYVMLPFSSGLQDVMGIEGVDGRKTTSNHVIEVQQTLGIEAARKCIIEEIKYTMESHGMNIDIRHMMLLADVMTFRVSLSPPSVSLCSLFPIMCFSVAKTILKKNIIPKNRVKCLESQDLESKKWARVC